jgi:hypothetical protein
MIGELIALLFLSRDFAHRAHLKVSGPGSFAAHTALGAFYDEVIDLADSLAEAYQGRNGIIEDIPYLDTDDGEAIAVLEKHMKWIEDNRYEAIPRTDTALQNMVDEIVGLYLSTLYKLKNLK